MEEYCHKKSKSEISKVLPWTGGKSGPDIKKLPEEMTITPWITMKGVKDEALIVAILSWVK